MYSALNVISVCAGHNALSKEMLLRTAHAALRTRNVSYWHKADIGGSELLPCKLTPEPHRQSQIPDVIIDAVGVVLSL